MKTFSPTHTDLPAATSLVAAAEQRSCGLAVMSGARMITTSLAVRCLR
jgi:hypothetical protein